MSERSLLELAGIISDEEAAVMLEAIQQQDEQSRRRLDELVSLLDS